MTLQWENAYGKEYALQTSDDGQTWSQLRYADQRQGRHRGVHQPRHERALPADAGRGARHAVRLFAAGGVVQDAGQRQHAARAGHLAAEVPGQRRRPGAAAHAGRSGRDAAVHAGRRHAGDALRRARPRASRARARRGLERDRLRPQRHGGRQRQAGRQGPGQLPDLRPQLLQEPHLGLRDRRQQPRGGRDQADAEGQRVLPGRPAARRRGLVPRVRPRRASPATAG